MKALLCLGLILATSANAALYPAASGLKCERAGLTLWRLELDTPEGRAYFHPLALPSGRILTDCRPRDHIWHLGWWFSWKYLNGVNYWEPADKLRCGCEPAGETRLLQKFVLTEGESVRVKLFIAYGKRGFSEPLLKEERLIFISAPGKDNAYSITVRHEFTALDECIIDRTPPHGSTASGKWGGGYAGATLRLDAEAAKMLTRVSGAGGGKSASEVTGVETNSVTLRAGATGEGFTFTQLAGPDTARFYLWPDLRFINASCVYTSALTLKRGEKLCLAYRLETHGAEK